MTCLSYVAAMKTTSDLSRENFELGFWHPFGSHGRESPEEIIDRKRRDRPGSLTTTADCREYRFVGRDDVDWRPVPPLIRVPHPFGPKKVVASAFVVRCIYHPVKLLQRPFVEWFKGDKWDERKIPTRPEFLIRRGG